MDNETTSTATTPSVDTSEADVRNAALSADSGTDSAPLDTQSDASETPTSQEQNDGQPTEQGSESTPEEGTSPEKPKPEQQPQKQKPTKPETPFSKAQKEQARLADSWKKLDAEKGRVRQLEAQLNERLARLEQQQAQTPTPPADTGPSADVYDQLAKKYDAEGDEHMANLAREAAQKKRTEAAARPQAQQAPADPTSAPEFKANWNRHVQELVAANPTLNEPENPLAKDTMALVHDPEWGRFFKAHPHGIKAAFQVAQLKQSAAQVPALQAELKKAQAEIGRLNKLTKIGGSHPSAPATSKKLNELNGQDAEDFVRSQAEAADRAA